MKLFLCVLFPIVLIASEPPWKNADQPKRTHTTPIPQRVEGSRDLRKQAAKNAHHNRLMTLLNCCKGNK